MFLKVILQAVCFCYCLIPLKAMDNIIDTFLSADLDPAYVRTPINVTESIEICKIIGKVQSGASLIANVVPCLFDGFSEAQPLVAFSTFYCACIYASISFDWNQPKYCADCAGEEETKLLKKLIFHQRQQAFLYATGSICMFSNQLVDPTLRSLFSTFGMVFLLTGTTNSFLFS